MPYQPVNVGTIPDDQTGDQARLAFQKTNANFVELYAGTANVSVTYFGADPTGVSDSGPAFTLAAASSLYVYIPPGTYKIATQVNCGARQVCFVGASRGSVTLNLSTSVDAFTWTAAAVTGGGFRHALIDVNSMTGGFAISMKGQSRLLINDLTFRGSNTASGAIYLEDLSNMNIHDVYSTGNYGTNGAFIKAVGTTAVAFGVLDIMNVLYGGAGAASATSSYGLLLQGGINTVDIRHFSAVACYQGIVTINPSALSTFCQFIDAVDIQFDGLYGDAIILGTAGAGNTGTHYFNQVYIHNSGTNNVGTGAGNGNGIYLYSNCREASFQGGVIVTCNLIGMFIDANSIRVTDFKISKNSQLSVGTYPGIELGANSFECKIENNMVGIHTGSSTSDMSYGVQLDAGAKRNTIQGNTLQSNTLGPILNTAADPNTFIDGNLYVGRTPFNTSLTPAALSATHNNYNPTNWSVNVSRLLLTPPGGGSTINGLFTGSSASTWFDGCLILIRNQSTADNITFTHLNGGSNAWNQFSLAGAASLVLGPLASRQFSYDGVDGKWIAI